MACGSNESASRPGDLSGSSSADGGLRADSTISWAPLDDAGSSEAPDGVSGDAAAGNDVGGDEVGVGGDGYGATADAGVDVYIAPTLCQGGSTQPCTVDNGSGTQTCNSQGTAYGPCQATSCQTNYVLNGGACVDRLDLLVSQAYQLVLQRAPDAEGVTHHLNKVRSGEMTGLDVLISMVYSSEFLGQHSSVTDHAFVTFLFQRFLEREPDTVGRQHYLNKIAHNNYTRSQVAAEMLASPEFRNLPSHAIFF